MINVFCTTTITTTTVKLPLLRKKWKFICNICRKITPYIINNIIMYVFGSERIFPLWKEEKKLVLDFCKNQTWKNKKQLLKTDGTCLQKEKIFNFTLSNSNHGAHFFWGKKEKKEQLKNQNRLVTLNWKSNFQKSLPKCTKATKVFSFINIANGFPGN